VSSWLLDFADPGGLAGFVRLELREPEQIAWYWTYLVGVPDVDGVVVVRDHEVLLPRQGLEIRADGLWAELWCEAPGVHWTFGLEAFGVRLDEPADALRAGGEIGERLAVGLDIEWDARADGPPAGTVHGDVLVGRARHQIDGPGWFYEGDPAAGTDAGAAGVGAAGVGAVVTTVYVPLGDDTDSGYLERRLVRGDDGLRWFSAPMRNRGAGGDDPR
jgi:hypothetical protein